jgi:tripeptide aminopeptidase
MSAVVERFLRYAKIYTESKEEMETIPSTEVQWDLANLLVEELKSLGLQNVSVDDHAYVTATLPANIEKDIPRIGFVAHMDTSPETTGKNVKPQFVENYDGGDIILNKELGVVLSPTEFPELKKYVGQTLITTSGDTLLGSDDKAGIAEIMTAIEYLVEHPEIKHGTIQIGFTPDEEVGRGADLFDVEKFGADLAYTVDGGEVGELEYESFNAAGARIKVHGLTVHPGSAKDKLVNSLLIAMEFHGLLPVNQRPEHTAGYEGYFYLMRMKGVSEETEMVYLIRDHDRKKFEQKKQLMLDIAEFLNKKYGEGRVEIELKDQYYNMREQIEPVIHIVDTAKQAMQSLGIKPIIKAIRGGTDGARFSFMGLPTPNIFTGGHNLHGKYEYIPVESMEKSVQVILKIISLYAEK